MGSAIGRCQGTNDEEKDRSIVWTPVESAGDNADFAVTKQRRASKLDPTTFVAHGGKCRSSPTGGGRTGYGGSSRGSSGSDSCADAGGS